MTRKRTHKARARKPARTIHIYQYSALDMMLASPSEPLAAQKRTHQLSRMWQALASIESGPHPTAEDWRLCSDAVNLLETLVTEGDAAVDANGQRTRGWWRDIAGDWVRVTDNSGLLMDAVTALAMAGRRYFAAGTIRLDGPGIQAVRSVLEDYAGLLEVLPARAVLQAHRATEKRIHAILQGHRQAPDVEVMDL